MVYDQRPRPTSPCRPGPNQDRGERPPAAADLCVRILKVMKSRHDLLLTPLIVGCWQLDDRSWKPISEADMGRALDTYLALGVNSFDTADIYGRSEEILGRLLKGRDCTILTKVVFFADTVPSLSEIRYKIENSLRNLRRDRLDLVQVHWQNPAVDFASTFAALQELQEQGKINKLGVTNFNTPMVEKALRYASIQTHQIQYSLIDRRVEATMQQLCLTHDIGLLCYGPLAGGYLSGRFRGQLRPQREVFHARGFYYSRTIQQHGGWSVTLKLLETVAEIAEKYHRTLAQVALNWVRHQPGVQAVISGLTLDRHQIQANVEALDLRLEPEDLQALSERSAALFHQPGDIYSYERQYP